jgi:hypothetical protein
MRPASKKESRRVSGLAALSSPRPREEAKPVYRRYLLCGLTSSKVARFPVACLSHWTFLGGQKTILQQVDEHFCSGVGFAIGFYTFTRRTPARADVILDSCLYMTVGKVHGDDSRPIGRIALLSFRPSA